MTSNNQQTSNNEFGPHLMDQELLEDLRKKNLIGSDHEGERPFWGAINIGDYNYFVPSTSGVEKVKYSKEAIWKIEKDKIVFKDLNESDGYLTIRSKDLDNNATNPDEIVLILDFNNMVCVPDKMFVETYFSYDNQKMFYEDQTTYCLNSLTQEDFEVVLEKNTNSQDRLKKLRNGFVQVKKGKKNTINDAETAHSQYVANEYKIKRAKHQNDFIIDKKQWKEVVRKKVEDMRSKKNEKYKNIETESKNFFNSKENIVPTNKNSSKFNQPYNKNNYFAILSASDEGNITLGGPMCNPAINRY